MFVLDTDHLVILQKRSGADFANLLGRSRARERHGGRGRKSVTVSAPVTDLEHFQGNQNRKSASSPPIPLPVAMSPDIDTTIYSTTIGSFTCNRHHSLTIAGRGPAD